MIEIKIVVFLCLIYFYYIIVKKYIKKKKKGVFDFGIIFNRGDLYILMN